MTRGVLKASDVGFTVGGFGPHCLAYWDSICPRFPFAVCMSKDLWCQEYINSENRDLGYIGLNPRFWNRRSVECWSMLHWRFAYSICLFCFGVLFPLISLFRHHLLMLGDIFYDFAAFLQHLFMHCNIPRSVCGWVWYLRLTGRRQIYKFSLYAHSKSSVDPWVSCWCPNHEPSNLHMALGYAHGDLRDVDSGYNENGSRTFVMGDFIRWEMWILW